MAGLYSHTTRSTGTVLTANIYNTDHQTHIDNHIPAQMDDYSVSVGQMQTTTDPGEVGTESLPTTLSGELERLRNMIKEITGKAQWYVTPTRLDDIEGLAVTDGGIIVGDGTNFVLESGAAARTSLGLVIGTDVQAQDAVLAALAALGVTDGNFIVGNGSTFVAENGATARTSLGLGALALLASINNGNWVGTDLAVANGGTGASSGAAALANLGVIDWVIAQSIVAAGYQRWNGDLVIQWGSNSVSANSSLLVTLPLALDAQYAAATGWSDTSTSRTDNCLAYAVNATQVRLVNATGSAFTFKWISIGNL